MVCIEVHWNQLAIVGLHESCVCVRMVPTEFERLYAVCVKIATYDVDDVEDGDVDEGCSDDVDDIDACYSIFYSVLMSGC